MLTEDRRANILSISVGSLAISHTVSTVEKFVERAKAVCEPIARVWHRPYRTAETAVIGAQCNNQTELGGAGGRMDGGSKVSNNLSILFACAPSLYSR